MFFEAIQNEASVLYVLDFSVMQAEALAVYFLAFMKVARDTSHPKLGKQKCLLET